MKKRNYFITAGIAFGVATLLHGYRSIYSLDLTIGNYLVPIWISYLLVIVAGYLSYTSFKLSKTR